MLITIAAALFVLCAVIVPILLTRGTTKDHSAGPWSSGGGLGSGGDSSCGGGGSDGGGGGDGGGSC